MLGGGVDEDRVALVRDRQRGLGFKVEVVLAADLEFAGKGELGEAEGGFGVASRDRARGAEEAPFGDGVFYREDRLELVHLDSDEFAGGGEGFAGFGGDDDDRVAKEGCDVVDEEVVVLEDGADVVVAGDAAAGKEQYDTGDGAGGG